MLGKTPDLKEGVKLGSIMTKLKLAGNIVQVFTAYESEFMKSGFS